VIAYIYQQIKVYKATYPAPIGKKDTFKPESLELCSHPTILASRISLKGMVLIKGRRLTESLEEDLGSENILDDTTLEDDDSTVGISDVLLPTEVRELVRYLVLGTVLNQIVQFHVLFVFSFSRM
jgi:hypothetical protein